MGLYGFTQLPFFASVSYFEILINVWCIHLGKDLRHLLAQFDRETLACLIQTVAGNSVELRDDISVLSLDRACDKRRVTLVADIFTTANLHRPILSDFWICGVYGVEYGQTVEQGSKNRRKG